MKRGEQSRGVGKPGSSPCLAHEPNGHASSTSCSSILFSFGSGVTTHSRIAASPRYGGCRIIGVWLSFYADFQAKSCFQSSFSSIRNIPWRWFLKLLKSTLGSLSLSCMCTHIHSHISTHTVKYGQLWIFFPYQLLPHRSLRNHLQGMFRMDENEEGEKAGRK